MTGFLIVFGIIHILFVIIPLLHTLRASISIKSKLIWCGFLVFLPFVGVFIFHRKFDSGLYKGTTYEINAADERARAGTLAPQDND